MAYAEDDWDDISEDFLDIAQELEKNVVKFRKKLTKVLRSLGQTKSEAKATLKELFDELRLKG